MTGTRRYGLAVLALTAAGCSEELGPVRLKTTRVTGVVRSGPTPITGGWIEFAPVDGTVGNLRSAPIRPDGTFTAEGVAVGKNLVGLAGTPGLSRVERQFFDTLRSRVRRTIPDAPAPPLVIDLLQEAVASRSDRPEGE